MDMPDRIYAERDPGTNEKRWYSTKGMGDEYVRAALYEQLRRDHENVLRAALAEPNGIDLTSRLTTYALSQRTT